MHIHEYQAKKLFQEYGIPTLEGMPAFSMEDVKKIMESYRGQPVVLKAQIHAGGRGKAGGVLLANDTASALAAAEGLFGKVLHTKQTGSEGKCVHRLYVERQAKVEKEYYISLLVDPATGLPTFIASSEGGMEIEAVAQDHPERIHTVAIPPEIGYKAYHGFYLANKLKLAVSMRKEFVALLGDLYRLFWEKDCTMIEINPLGTVEGGHLIALDAKVELDSSAFFRHADNAALRDRGEEPELEAQASDSGMNYVALDGNIGCLVIGAGLGMSTMDAIQYFGGQPANFMDCGGSVTVEKSKKALEIVANGHNVQGILVNIFGGITRTDLIAQGIVEAVREHGYTMPLVVRLEGTNSAEANELLSQSGIPLVLASSLTEGAKRIISLVAQRGA